MHSHLQKLSTYAEARKVIGAFAQPNGLNFVVMVSPPGVGKTNTFKALCAENMLYLQGSVSPVKMYCELFHNRNKPVVFDDVDELFDTKAGVNLIKCLGQTDKVKHLMWEKASSVLREEDVPNQFVTRSRLLIFANCLVAMEENLGAALDRAHSYWFDPPPNEVHREVHKWFRDREIFRFIESNLDQIERLNMRDYVKAKELKEAGLDWRDTLLKKWHADPKLAAMISLLADVSLSPSERQLQFKKLGFGEEATYKRYLARANKVLKRPSGKHS